MDIRGRIAEVYHIDSPGTEEDAVIGNILVEGVIEADTKYDRASITITNGTAIFEQRGEERVRVSFDDVAVGQRAEARFAGPVKETYPFQGTAAELVLLPGN